MIFTYIKNHAFEILVFSCILFLVVFSIHNLIKGEKGTYTPLKENLKSTYRNFGLFDEKPNYNIYNTTATSQKKRRLGII